MYGKASPKTAGSENADGAMKLLSDEMIKLHTMIMHNIFHAVLKIFFI